MDSPFQAADPKEGFGFEPVAAAAASPAFEAAASPFASAPAQDFSSPFATVVTPTETAASQPFTPAAFSSWQEPVSPPTPADMEFGNDGSDSAPIKQLELRAIFGVARELSREEIMQRSRALPGIRHVALVGREDMAAVEAIKRTLLNLGFGQGGLKLYSGSVPVEFIREGEVQLAVQTDGGFAPGVRETLMLVARELGRMG
jgi:hypothetical protein